MSLLPRALLKNYSQDALKPLEDECNAFDKVDFFSSPQAASHNVSIQSNRTQLVGTVGKIPNLLDSQRGFRTVTEREKVPRVTAGELARFYERRTKSSFMSTRHQYVGKFT